MPFLGHIVSGIDLRPDPEKIRVVQDWKEPTSVSGIRQFLGFTNYFRRFIDGYAFIARPLEELTGKNKRFSWNEECQASFEALRWLGTVLGRTKCANFFCQNLLFMAQTVRK